MTEDETFHFGRICYKWLVEIGAAIAIARVCSTWLQDLHSIAAKQARACQEARCRVRDATMGQLRKDAQQEAERIFNHGRGRPHDERGP